jgi:putative thiamine transport system substrate-binding protein
MRRRALLTAAALALAPRARAADWSDTLGAATGKEVFWNAWGGDDRTNAFIRWAAERLLALHGIAVHHVGLRDTSEAVARVVAEKAAGRDAGGSVDLIWLNGPNFLSMRQQGLLYGPVLDLLPNAALIDRTGKPATMVDFTVPTGGYEVPWRMAQIVFIRDAARVPAPPRSMRAMGDWAAAHPGRLTHPQVRNFLGATFLKQALVEFAPDRTVLQRPAGEAFAAATAPLWQWYAALRPHLWRHGAAFPDSGPAQRALLNDGEIDIMISFNPAEAAVAVATGTLPDTVRTSGLDGGTIGNCSFNAVAFNAANKPAALVLADFLLSPEAQAQAADPRVLGSPTVLALDRLEPADRARFDALPRSPAMPDAAELGTALAEPHPSWMTGLVDEWERRFGS